jgi:excisionase family DNA binding protein
MSRSASTPQPEPLYMSIAQYAAHIGVSSRTVRRRIKANHIPSLHIGSRRVVPWRQADLTLTQRLVKEEREIHRNPLRKSLAPTAPPPAEPEPLSRLSAIAFRVGDFLMDTGGQDETAP